MLLGIYSVRCRRLLALFVCCCAPVVAGCSTLATLDGDANKTFDCNTKYRIPRVYSGVANDVRFIREQGEDWMICIFDLPLSAVADTVALPYTAVRQSKDGDLCTGVQTNATTYQSGAGAARPCVD